MTFDPAPFALPTIGVAAALAVVAWLAKAVSLSGAIAGLAVGVACAAGFGPAGFAALATFFVVGSIQTRTGWAVKKERGAAERGEGARGARRVIGKGGVAAALGAAAALGHVHDAAFVGALAAALADTMGTEMGTLSASEPRSLPSLRRVPHGTPGAVSLRGLWGALMGGVLVAVAARMAWIWIGGTAPVARDVVVACGLSGFVAALLESLVVGFAPAVKRAPGWVRNLGTTAAGAALAHVAAGALR